MSEILSIDEFLAIEPAHIGVVGCKKCGTDWKGPNAAFQFVNHVCPLPQTCVDCGETFRGPNASWLCIQVNHLCSSLEENQ
jgi:hypothetical protein